MPHMVFKGPNWDLAQKLLTEEWCKKMVESLNVLKAKQIFADAYAERQKELEAERAVLPEPEPHPIFRAIKAMEK